MKEIDAFKDSFKEQLEKEWLAGFKKESEFENLIFEDPSFSAFHQKMGDIRSREDFWKFYLRLKRDITIISPNKLTFFQRAKATQFFILYCGDPLLHWFFVQAIDALEHELYIPACSSMLNGIEASLRVTIHQLEKSEDILNISPYQVLSNPLISKARDFGLPVHTLALSNESGFESKLNSTKPNRIDVEVVRIRNNICHGNITEYIDGELGKEFLILTPECLREVAFELVNTSRLWVYSLGIFRINKLLHGHLRFQIKQNARKSQ